MVKTSTELPETIKCGNKDCGYDITVIDCYFLNKPEVPQIGIKCPECNKVTTLSKAKSVAYAAEYNQIQEDIDSALGYKVGSLDEMDEFGDRVMRALDAFGYKGSKYTQTKRSIREMVDNVPSYQTYQGLQTLLNNMKIQPNHAMMVTQRVFSSEQPPTIDMGMQPMSMNQYAPMYPQQSLQQPGMYPQQSLQQPGMYPQQQYPPQIPVQSNNERITSADDEITITEKIDSDGKVTERIIKQPKAAETGTDKPAEMSMVDQFKEMINVMTDAGIIHTNEKPVEDANTLTADDIGAVISQYLGNNESDDKYDSLVQQIDSLKTELTLNKEAGMQSQIDSLKADISKRSTDSKLSDSQYAEGVKKDIETMRVDAVSSIIDKFAKPIMEIQANQSKTTTALMIDELEQRRGAPPGSYAGMFGSSVPDDEVQSDLGKWRERAERVTA